jgi:hypothetical protein
MAMLTSEGLGRTDRALSGEKGKCRFKRGLGLHVRLV